MLKKGLNYMKNHKLLCFLIIMTILKQFIVSQLPIWALTNELYDDDMMVQMAQNILNGDWLGEYSSNTLVKGCFFPLLLAIINRLGLSYISTMNFIYTLACIFFVYAIRNLFKNKKILAIVYLALLFNPVSFGGWVLQRVYRNGITLSQVLFIIGSMYAIYEKRKDDIKKILPYAIVAGISLGTMWNTREDGIWILPFVLVVTILVVVLVIITYKKELKKCIKKVAICCLPLIIMALCTNLIRLTNLCVYGVYTSNELNDGYFGKVIQSLYSIKTDEDIEYVTVTRNKLNIAYEISPTLNSIKSNLEAAMDLWDTCDRHPSDSQVEDGWFWWALKDGVSSAGKYVTASTSDAFYKQVYEEIEQAKAEGRVQAQTTMPSKLMSPWKSRYFKEELETMGTVLKYMITYDGVSTVNMHSEYVSDQNEIRNYEALTHDFAIYPTELSGKISGWYVSKDKENITLSIENENGQELYKIETIESPDVYKVLQTTQNECEYAKNCRFDINLANEIEEGTYEELYLVSKNENGQVKEKINIESLSSGESVNSDISIYSIDSASIYTVDENSKYTLSFVTILNYIGDFYSLVGIPVAALAIFSYVVLTVFMLVKREEKLVSIWLLETGIVLSLLVLVAGVSYNHITSCYSIFYMYLSGGYPLMIAFFMIAIVFVLDNIDRIFKKKISTQDQTKLLREVE